MSWSSASKAVGWEKRSMEWPSLKEVFAVVEKDDLETLLAWNRFLPSPETDQQRTMLNLIVQALRRQHIKQ